LKYLGIDYGNKRIGLAISDELGMFAKPIDALQNKSVEVAISQISSLIHRENINFVVIGIPDTGRKSELDQIKIIKSFASKLCETTKISFEYWNESFSSIEAFVNLKAKGNKSKSNIEKKLDSESARIILQGYLDFKNSKI
jgi:putative Holliday junction resolvase